MSTIANLMVSLGLNSKEFDKGIGDAEKSSGRLSKGLGTVGKLTAAAAGGVAAAGGAAAAAAISWSKNADEIDKNASKAGVATDAYQELQFAAGQVGFDGMDQALQRTTRRMGQAADGNDKYASALEQMGISMDDVKNGTVSTDEAFMTAIDTLSKMENEQEQAALAADFFGQNMSSKMLPMIREGEEGIADLRDRAHELGHVMGEDAIDAGVQFQDTWDEVTTMLGGVRNEIGAQVLPILQQLLEWILDYMPEIQAMFSQVFEIISEIIGVFVKIIQGLIDTIQDLFDSSDVTLSDLADIYVTYWSAIYETVEWAIQAVWSVIEEVLSHVVAFIGEQLQRIQEWWEEHGDMIMQAVDNAFSFIQMVIETVMPIIQEIIRVAWNIIKQIIDTAIGIIMGLIQTFSGLLTGDFEAIKEGLSTIWKSLWDLIKTIVEGAWDLLSGAFRSLWRSISGWFTDLVSDAFDWGRNMISGFTDGIKAMARAPIDAAKNVMDNVKSFLGFSSPAEKGEGRHIEDWGSNMVDGFLDGVNAEANEAKSVLNDLLKGVKPQSDLDKLLPDGHAVEMISRLPSSKTDNESGKKEKSKTEQINFEKMFEGANFYVRDDQDIKKIARELHNLIKRKERGEGIG